MKLENSKKSTKSINNKQQKASIYKGPNRSWIMLDAVVFLILMLLVSVALILLSSAPKDPDYYFTNYQETDEYLENSMEMVLSSTVPMATYRDLNGFETEFVDQSMENLIIIDLNIRCSSSDEVNSTSLEHDLEHELMKVLEGVIGSDQEFVFTCSYASQSGEISVDNSIIFITNLDETYKLKESAKPSFEKHLLASGNGEGNRGGDEVIIRLYFI
jgi:hypothetical protein